MTKQPFLFVGLDYERTSEVVGLAEELAEVDRKDFGFKLNLDFYINSALGGDLKPLSRIGRLHKPIFADFKMWNGRRTMISIAENLFPSYIDYTNIYAHAGETFLRSVVESVEGSRTRILGVTVLTHYKDSDCQRLYGRSLRDSVRMLSEIAFDGSCHGIILPGTTLDMVTDLPIQKLVPAVRPKWYGITGDNDQEQEIYVGDAVRNGADLLVCSSPIRKSKNRKEALIRTLDEMY